MDRATVEVYEGSARRYHERRGVQRARSACGAFADAVDGRTPRPRLPGPASTSRCSVGRRSRSTPPPACSSRPAANAPDAPVVRADLARTCRSGAARSRACGRARRTSTSLAEQLPMAFADVHHALRVGRSARAHDVRRRRHRHQPTRRRPPGPAVHLVAAGGIDHVLVGAGFVVDVDRAASARVATPASRPPPPAVRTLPDYVDGGMRLLCCGLNPSLHAADAGIGYVTPGNRFWPALRDAGLTTLDRDPRRLLAPRPHRHDRRREAGHRPGGGPHAPPSTALGVERLGPAVRVAPSAGDLLRRPRRLAGGDRPARRRSAGSPATSAASPCT